MQRQTNDNGQATELGYSFIPFRKSWNKKMEKDEQLFVDNTCTFV